jgi:hypothetical protein
MSWFGVRKIEEAHTAALVGAMTAPSGTTVDLSSGMRPQGWQADAWRLWRVVGELHSPTAYIARIVSRRIGWTVAEGARVLTPEQAGAAFKAALGTTSLEELVRLVVLNLQVAGELWLIQTPTGWDVVPVTAAKLADRVRDAKAAGLDVQRIYDPDPSDPDNADSSVRTVLDPADDLLTLSALSRAQSRSRIAQAGLLLVPVEQKFDGGDPFGGGLEASMVAAIKDVHSASAVSPIKVEMAAELIEKVRHVTFDRPFDDAVPAKVEQAIRRIALGLDIPPELLLGMGGENHWSAWVTQEETYRGTISPMAETVAGVLEHIFAVTGPVYTVTDDPTELLARRSSVRDAIDAAGIGAVGLAYVRSAIGAGADDAATIEDIATISLLTGKSALSETTVDQQPSAPTPPT